MSNSIGFTICGGLGVLFAWYATVLLFMDNDVGNGIVLALVSTGCTGLLAYDIKQRCQSNDKELLENSVVDEI